MNDARQKEVPLSDVTSGCEPNQKTMDALKEAERISRDPEVKRYRDVEKALRELKQ